MVKTKQVRTSGKIQLSRYFQEFEEGDFVSIVKELSVNSNFPERIQGRTGVVEGRRGRAYIVRINDHKNEKRFLVEPVHLKKIKIGKTQ